MLLFPPTKDPPASALDAFSFQPWTTQKTSNASLVIALSRTLVSGAGSGKAANQKAILAGGLTRCLLELALASTATSDLKSSALHALADIVRGSKANQDLVGSLVLNPIGSTVAPPPPSSPTIDSTIHTINPHDPAAPRPSTSSDTFRPKDDTFRTGPQPAILALISLAVSGPPGLDDPEVDVRLRTQRDVLRLRAAAVHLLDAYVSGNPDGQLSIVATMSATPPDANPNSGHDMVSSQTIARAPSPQPRRSHSAGSLLLSVLRTLPIGVPGVGFDSYSPFFACLIFAHLLRGSEQAKQVARKVSDSPAINGTSGRHEPDDDDDDERTGLVHTLVGNLMMSQRAQGQGSNAGEGQARALEWARVMVGYLVVLSVWMWESPKTAKEFLSEGTNLQVVGHLWLISLRFRG